MVNFKVVPVTQKSTNRLNRADVNLKQTIVNKESLLEISKAFNNANALVRIFSNTPGAKFRVKAFINSGFNFYSNNNWDSPLDNALNNRVFKYNSDVQRLQATIGAFLPSVAANTMVSKVMSTSMRSSYNSLAQYTGSSIPKFEIDGIIINYSHSINVLDDLTVLQGMTLPYHSGKL